MEEATKCDWQLKLQSPNAWVRKNLKSDFHKYDVHRRTGRQSYPYRYTTLHHRANSSLFTGHHLLFSFFEIARKSVPYQLPFRNTRSKHALVRVHYLRSENLRSFTVSLRQYVKRLESLYIPPRLRVRPLSPLSLYVFLSHRSRSLVA